MFSQQNNLASARLSVLIGHMLAMLGPSISAIFVWRIQRQEALPNWKRSRLQYYVWGVLAMIAFWTLPGNIEENELGCHNRPSGWRSDRRTAIR
jgi:hypothetical protein